MSEKLDTIRKQIEELSLTDALKFVKMCEEMWGVSAAAPVAAIAAQSTEAVAEKTEFEVFLIKVGAEKIAVMKKVREVTQKDLATAKKIVDDATEAAPSLIGVFAKDQAAKLQVEFEGIGAGIKIV